MHDNRTKGYRFLFFATCLLMLARVAIAVAVFVSLFVEIEESSLSSLVIRLLLADLATLVLLWSFNRGTRLFGKRTSAVFLLTPTLLFVVFVLSIMIDISSSTAKTLEIICWVLMWAYILIPNIFLFVDFANGAKNGFPGKPGDPKDKPLSQRIREARK